MKKIAHIQLLPILSGVQRVTLEELQRLDKKCFELHLVCKEEGPLTQAATKLEVTVHTISCLTRNISILNDLRAFWKLYLLFKREQFDIVHTHSSKTGVLGRLAAKIAGVPKIVHTVHGYAFPAAKSVYSRWLYITLERLGGMCSDHLVCLHDQDRDIAINKLNIKEECISIIPNGVDTALFRPPSCQEKYEIRKEFSISNESIVIGMVGRLWEQKNPLLLLKASIKLVQESEQYCIVFVGDGELQEDMLSEVKNLGLESNFRFLGWREDTNMILRSFDVFSLPSKWEGMPLAILEASSSGIPSVVSDIPGNNHLIKHDINGLLFDSDNVDSLYKQLSYICSNVERRFAMGHEARKMIEEKYCIENRVKAMALIYLS